MRSSASLFLPILLLLAGCGGIGLGTADADPQGSAPPARLEVAERDEDARPRRADAAEPFYARPGTSYGTPTASAAGGAAPDLPDEANSYRTADGRVHMLPRARQAAAQPSAGEATSPAPPARRAEPAAAPRAAEGPPPSDGPQGSSLNDRGEERYDVVGYAGVRGVSGSGAMANAVVAVHPSLPAGTILEITSLDAGRTILVLVTATMPVPPDHVVDLSTAAARLLGGEAGGTLAVRVRKVVATPQDVNLLRSGQAASERIDAPPALVSALRRRLGAPVSAGQVQPPRIASVALPPSRPASKGPGASYAAPGRAPTAPVRATPSAASNTGYVVQLAALSTPERAQALARSVGGSVRAAGALYKVQVGPYATPAQAESARAQLVARGYGGGVIVRLP